MAHKYRVKRKKKQTAALPAAVKKPFPKKKALILLGSILLMTFLYQLAVALSFHHIVDVYCIAAGVLLLAYVIVNRGLFRIPERDELNPTWDDEKKDAFIASQKRRKKATEPLLFLTIAVIFAVFFDLVYIFLTLNLGLFGGA